MLHEAQVIAQVRTGHSDAFGEIIEHYQVPIVRYLQRMTGTYEVAQDLAQDTFVQAFRGVVQRAQSPRLAFVGYSWVRSSI